MGHFSCRRSLLPTLLLSPKLRLRPYISQKVKSFSGLESVIAQSEFWLAESQQCQQQWSQLTAETIVYIECSLSPKLM